MITPFIAPNRRIRARRATGPPVRGGSAGCVRRGQAFRIVGHGPMIRDRQPAGQGFRLSSRPGSTSFPTADGAPIEAALGVVQRELVGDDPAGREAPLAHDARWPLRSRPGGRTSSEPRRTSWRRTIVWAVRPSGRLSRPRISSVPPTARLAEARPRRIAGEPTVSTTRSNALVRRGRAAGRRAAPRRRRGPG